MGAFIALLRWLVAKWKESYHDIHIVLGVDAPFHTYRRHLHSQTHLINIGVINRFAKTPLTNCALYLKQSVQTFSLDPVPIKTGFTLNPGASKYIKFVELKEPRSGPPFSAPGAGILAYFPINPLPSDKSSWLDDPPYALSLWLPLLSPLRIAWSVAYFSMMGAQTGNGALKLF